LSEGAHLAAVIVNFRTPRATAAAVRSLQASQRAPDDILVVDNGSDDESTGMMQRMLAGVSIVASAENRGFAGGCNLGVAEALGRGADMVLLLNSDAVVDRGCLGALERELAGQPDAGIVGALVLRQSGHEIESRGIVLRPLIGRVKLRDYGRRFEPADLPPGERVAAVSGCAMLIHRAVFDRVGMLSEDYFWGLEDVDYCVAAANAGFGIFIANDAIVRHEGSLSIGRASAERVYWATSNHLLLLDRRCPQGPVVSALRRAVVVGLNLAYALTAPGVPRASGAVAVLRGVGRYIRLRGRVG
jgi:hypothetical protein